MYPPVVSCQGEKNEFANIAKASISNYKKEFSPPPHQFFNINGELRQVKRSVRTDTAET